MKHRDIVVVGASAGGVEALRVLASGLPKNFKASIFVVMHMSLDSPGFLAKIIERSGPLPAAYAQDGQGIEEGRLYVAPVDYHLLLEFGRMRLSRGPRENLFRPAIDPLFRSAAQTYQDRVIGVILTGALDDGTSGLQAVKQMGGLAVIQDPRDALVPSMPASALQHVSVDYCLPLKEISPLLAQLTISPIEEKEGSMVPEDLRAEVAISSGDNAIASGLENLGQPSRYACPECHGVLLQLKGSDPPRFRCHVGHAYSTVSLISDCEKRIDESLWTATRALEESMILLQHVANHSDEHNIGQSREQLIEQTRNLGLVATRVREALNIRKPLLGNASE